MNKKQNDIENYRVKYITDEEAKKLWENDSFCPAYYPLYDGGGRIILYDGEIGCYPTFRTRFIMKNT